MKLFHVTIHNFLAPVAEEVFIVRAIDYVQAIELSLSYAEVNFFHKPENIFVFSIFSMNISAGDGDVATVFDWHSDSLKLEYYINSTLYTYGD